MTGQAIRFGVQLVGMTVLARVLLPADFGVFSKTIAVTGFIAVMRTGGLSVATVQRADITHGQVSNLFWLNAMLGLVAGGIVVAASPMIARFYNDPRVEALAAALGGVVVIGSLSVQHAALLQRQMRFCELAAIGALAPLAGFLAAVASAVAGAGYWSLLIQQAVTELANLVMVVARCRWWPAAPRRHSGVSPMLRMGAFLSGTNLLGFASRNTDNLLIGRFVSDAALGYYTIAYRLLLLPLQQVNGPVGAVVLPGLSRLQHDPERYARFHTRAVGLMVFLTMPAVCFLAVDTGPLVRLVLGAAWLPVASVFQALSVAAFVSTFNVATSWVYTSLGRTRRQLRWQLLAVPCTILGFLVGLRWGALGVAGMFSASQLLLALPSLRYCYRGTPLSVASTLATLARPALASLAACAVLYGLQRALPARPPAWLALDAFLFAAVYLATWYALPGGRAYLAQCARLVAELAPGAWARSRPRRENAFPKPSGEELPWM